MIMSYSTHIVYSIHIYICERYYFPLLLSLRWKVKEKQVLDFGLHVPIDLINLFNIMMFNKSF